MDGLLYLAAVDRAAGRDAGTRDRAQQLVSFVQEKARGQDIGDWETFYLAAAERLLGQKEQAYNHLAPLFSRILRNLPLMSQDPALDIFRNDPEFQNLTAKLENEVQKTRAEIRKTRNSD